MIFNKYGDRYFLSQLFDEGSTSGSKIVESRYEKKVSQASVNGQEHVSAKRRARQDNRAGTAWGTRNKPRIGKGES